MTQEVINRVEKSIVFLQRTWPPQAVPPCHLIAARARSLIKSPGSSQELDAKSIGSEHLTAAGLQGRY